MRKILVLLLLVISCRERRAATCVAADTLQQASAAYRDAELLSDTWRAKIRVPGAPAKREEFPFGFRPGVDAAITMPKLYAIEVRDGRVVVVEVAGIIERFVDRPAAKDLQTTLDEAFGGQGAPLAPIPLLLRAATTDAARVDAFRLRMLSNLRAESCSRHEDGDEVTLRADNGIVRARFTRESFLARLDGEIVPAPGQPPIIATVSFSPRREPPPTIDGARLESARAVTSVAELSHGPALAVLPADRELRTLDGGTTRLGDLRGSRVILEFFATWCAPCRVTVPAVVKFARENKDTRVILINTQERAEPERVRAWLNAAGVDSVCLLDPDGALHRQLGGGLPLSVVVAPDGRIVETNAGFAPPT